MPQITLEYSDNCLHEGEFAGLFRKIHSVLQQTGGIRIENCKSRALEREKYFIADGDPVHAYAHLEIRFIEGRSEDIRESVGQQCLELLKEFFNKSIKVREIQITVEVADIRRQGYTKFPPGTLTQQVQ
jgi:5-carboxymethyl-2-hydroxymuconate isomerase